MGFDSKFLSDFYIDWDLVIIYFNTMMRCDFVNTVRNHSHKKTKMYQMLEMGS
jgi:hypothetical protein